MSRVILSCGHEDDYRPVSGWPLKLRDWEGGGKAISYSTVCRDCYINHIRYEPELIIFDSWEEDEYFNDS